MRLVVERAKGFGGAFRPPADKSLTHRAYMFAAIAEGESRVTDPLRAEDTESTLRILNQLGLRHEWVSEREARLIPVREWTQPKADLDCGNSGTTMRLMAGLLASRDLDVRLTGDASLSGPKSSMIRSPSNDMCSSFKAREGFARKSFQTAAGS